MSNQTPGIGFDKPEWPEVQVVVEFEGLDETAADNLRRLFGHDDEDVAYSHAFGGADAVAVLNKLGGTSINKLTTYFGNSKTQPSKTRIRIGKGIIEMNGFSREDVEALIASPKFMQLAKAALVTKS